MEKPQKLPKDKEKEEGRVQFCKKDWQLLLDWCEIESNLDSVKGTDKNTRVGMKYLTKRQAFDDLGRYINEHQFKGSTLVKLNWETARNRYNYLGGLYKKAKEIINGTGWGLTEKDEAKGIRTLDEKIEKLCPCYERVHAILGGTPRTDLRGNTLVTSVGGQAGEHLPWTEVQPDVVVEVVDVDADDSSDDVVVETGSHGPQKEMDDLVTEGSGPRQSTMSPIGVVQSPLPVPNSPAMPPAAEDPDEESTPEVSAVSTGKATKAVPGKSKSSKHGSYPNKRRHGSDKGQSLTGAFSSGMDNVSLEKAKSNDIKERAYELHFQSLAEDRALRSETFQRKLDLESERLAIESERVAIEKQKVTNELHASRLEAMLKIVNENKHRPPEELAAILAAFTSILPPIP